MRRPTAAISCCRSTATTSCYRARFIRSRNSAT
jgi:hypothetical protein